MRGRWVGRCRAGLQRHGSLAAAVLGVENGVPSHDTRGRVFRLLRPETLAEVLAEATERRFRAGADRHVALDGKRARRSFTDGDRNTGLHRVTAWASDLGLSLGQVVTDQESNEQSAMLKLVELQSIATTRRRRACMSATPSMSKRSSTAQTSAALPAATRKKWRRSLPSR